MTNEEKQLLIKDLCARLPYGVKIQRDNVFDVNTKVVETLDISLMADDIKYDVIEKLHIKPYLRPMSSMTEEERRIYEQRLHDVGRSIDVIDADDVVSHIDWLLSNHFDFRGLIPMGLALEAPKDMYKTE